MARGWSPHATHPVPTFLFSLLLGSGGLLGLLGPGCGGSGPPPAQPEPLRLLAVLPAGGLPADAPADLVVFVTHALAEGDGLGDPVELRLEATAGTPFSRGTSGVLTFPGRIVSPYEIVARVPPAAVEAPQGCAAYVGLSLRSGRSATSAEPWAFFDGPAPQIVAFEPAGPHVAGARSRFTVRGAGFGPLDAQVQVSFLLDDGQLCDGSRVLATTGRVVTHTRIEGQMPGGAIGMATDAFLRVALAGATVTSAETLLTLLPRSGTGRFTEIGVLEDLAARSVSVGDLDGDDVPDLVVASGEAADVHVLRGDGAGGYALAASLGAGGTAVSAAIADVDRDGDLDIVLVAEDRTPTSVWRGEGDGTFRDTGIVLPSGPWQHLALGDVDGDDRVDALLSRKGSGAVLLRGNGVGGFTAMEGALGSGGAFAMLGDLDADGLPDAVVGSGQGASVYRGDGTGDFAYAGQSLGKGGLRAGLLADLDGDGALDFVGGFARGGVRIFLGDGTGRLVYTGAPLADATGADTLTTGLARAPIDGDCRSDLLVSSVPGAEAGTSSQSVSVARARGGAHFDPLTSIVGQELGGARQVQPLDIDGDGDLDLLVVEDPTGALRILRNDR